MTNQKHRLLLGAHMSTSGGFEQAIYRGQALECTAIQIFTSNNRQWQAKEISDDSIFLFKEAQEKTSIDVIAHAIYLINLGSNSTDTQKKSRFALSQELLRCKALGIKYLVLHPGSGMGQKTDIIKIISEDINEIISKIYDCPMILLETMAGQGNVIGSNFHELANLRNMIENKEKIGICVDTCHLWSAGYDFSTPENYNELWNEFDQVIGINNLKAIHLNDSLKPKGSKVDRHADIGQGTMGLEPFRLIMNDQRFFDVPKILETPKDTPQDDARNLDVLKNLINNETKRLLRLQ